MMKKIFLIYYTIFFRKSSLEKTLKYEFVLACKNRGFLKQLRFGR